MDARPLRDLLADLVGDSGARQAYGADPAGYLAVHGHPGLPEALVAEAVVSYADTAPVEVAELLAPHVAAHGPVPGAATPEAADWFGLLTAAEVDGGDSFDEHTQPETPDWTGPGELDFGAGAGNVEEPVPAAADEVPVEETAPVADVAVEPEWSQAAFTPEPPIDGLEPEEDDEDTLD